MLSLFVGLGTSVLHVISGPDHLAAVTPLALSSRLKSWFVGLFWGIGHVLGALVIGGLFILMRDLIPLELISKHSEQLVGLILIIIGIWAFWRINRKDNHHHSYKISQSKTMLSAISIGIIHGLAGVSHIIGILPTLALPTKADAILYLAGFAAGTIITMIAFSGILGLITHKAVIQQKHLLYKRINATGGIFAILVGLYWIGHTL
ncbi:MAG: hypothetical protein CVU09_08570 [Bacteroidetes bacterium HGW-Bacteroidetes-4]|jgi:predicted membrane protein|nr:MAG: hypothetical protein CVU09_08570 [Bacteroidetes bacterium HGW-Bacteroidetes-4]